MTGRARWWTGGVAGLVVAGVVLAWVLWPEPEPPRARQYQDFDVCLLADEHGVAGQQAAPVWAGMQEASLATHVRVSYLSVVGPQTKENALPFVTSLAQRHCSVVFAVGAAQVAAASERASAFPKLKFVIVGGQASGSNVTVVDATSSDAVRGAVKDIVVKVAPPYE